MYSKLFASILDSSIWLEDAPTRIVWLTLLAAKDGEGFARFAAVDNLARRAIVSIEEAERAIEILEAPDRKSSNQDHEGRRIERVPGGWVVLNAKIYDGMVKREDERRSTRERVALHRERKRTAANPVPADEGAPAIHPEHIEAVDETFERAWALYPSRGDHGNPKTPALKAWRARVRGGVDPEEIIRGVERYAAFIRAKGNEGSEFVKQAATFFGPSRFWLEPWTPPANNGHASKQDVGRKNLLEAMQRRERERVEMVEHGE